MTPEQKKWIDESSYETLLHSWRYANQSPLFQGECGEYYKKIMNEKKNLLTHGQQVAASKAVDH